METQGPSSWKIPEHTWTGQSHGIHLALQATQSAYLTGKVDSIPHHDGVAGEDAKGEVGPCVQSHGIHLALQATQSAYLTGKVDSVPHHEGVVGEDGGGEVGSVVQSLGIHLALKAA
jgi:hypothetical protein